MADKYISAERAYAYLRIILYETATNNVGINDDFASACEEIADNRLKIWLDDIPAADVSKVRRAEWLHEQLALPLSDGSKECVRCSSCLTHWDNESNFCPYCGCAMEGRKNNERS